MKRIGIDARLYFQTGVGVYLRNFLHYLQEVSSDEMEFYVYLMQSDSDKITFHKKNFIKREVSYQWHSLNEQIGFLNMLNKDNLDLMHFTYFSYPIFYRKKFIATIHDTILLQHKTGKASTRSPIAYEIKHFGAKLAFSTQMRYASKIITPSKTVKQELVRLFGREEKIVPIYEGVNYEYIKATEDTSLKTVFKDDDFFIYVGNFYPHKNIESLIQAFARVSTNKKLILAGPEDFFRKQMQELVDKLGQNQRIFFYKKPTNSQLIYFYKHALALIHPSLSEGFCLPLVEAAYYKLPVIASDIPIFREVIDHAYQAFDPHDEAGIAHAIENFLKEKKHAAPALLAEFSFKSMTEKIFALYQTV